jgi:hypothetical protein
LSRPPHDDAEIAAAQAWLEQRGFRVDIRQEDGAYWADLISLAAEQVLAPKYGRGESPGGAASRAKARFEEEQ